ncbi:hypothetical protein RV02_GL000249 [Enterococcus gilvus]|nr:hypothetical protein RV02_GL000249 [Enterococcus gilvus]
MFRGINVGGKNSVKMQELRELFLELGFKDVRSYIQSGNIVFPVTVNWKRFQRT